jgi:plasmid stabilization system protein ParE
MARVTRRPVAAADILDVWDPMAQDSLEQADRWVDKLDEKFQFIATQPMMGQASNELAVDLRSFPLGVTSSSTHRSKTESMSCKCVTALAMSMLPSATSLGLSLARRGHERPSGPDQKGAG